MNIIINCSTIRARLYSDKIINVDYLNSLFKLLLKYNINTADTEQELSDLINYTNCYSIYLLYKSQIC